MKVWYKHKRKKKQFHEPYVTPERKKTPNNKTNAELDWMSHNQKHCKIANIKAHVTALQFNISNWIWQVSLSSLTSFYLFFPYLNTLKVAMKFKRIYFLNVFDFIVTDWSMHMLHFLNIVILNQNIVTLASY